MAQNRKFIVNVIKGTEAPDVVKLTTDIFSAEQNPEYPGLEFFFMHKWMYEEFVEILPNEINGIGVTYEDELTKTVFFKVVKARNKCK